MAKESTRARRGIPADIMMPRIMLLLGVLALLLLGFVMVYSASSIEAIHEGNNAAGEVLKQVAFSGLGIIAVAIIWKFIPPKVWLGPFALIVWGLSFLLLLATMVAGTEGLGATRWLFIGPIGIQPSEFAKIALVLMGVRTMYRYRIEEIDLKTAAVHVAVFILVPLALIFKAQSDLGTTMICLVGLLAVLWLGEVPLRFIAGLFVVAVVFGLVGIFGSGYRSDRMIFLDPWNDGEGGYGTGYQLIHSFYAFAEGGLFGVGIGNSRERFLYLPEAETDFIFAIVGEELGLIGALAVIALFLVLLYAGLRIAKSAQTSLGSMLAGSFTVMIVFQAFLNIACVIGVFPTTGKPLPFLSSGGSSLIATFIMVGLILSVSKEAAEPSVHERRRDDLRIVRAVSSDSGSSVAAAGARGSMRMAASESRGSRDGLSSRDFSVSRGQRPLRAGGLSGAGSRGAASGRARERR